MNGMTRTEFENYMKTRVLQETLTPDAPAPANRPVVVLDIPSIALLFHGHTLHLENVVIIPGDALQNTAASIKRGAFDSVTKEDKTDGNNKKGKK